MSGAILVRRGTGGKRREVGMDSWGWEQLGPWLQVRERLPVGALFCVISGPSRGRQWTQDAARVHLRRTAAQAAVRRRFAPHQLRHAHAVEMAREGVPIMVIQRQLGHANLGITSIYLQGIDNAEIMTPSTTEPHPSFRPAPAYTDPANAVWAWAKAGAAMRAERYASANDRAWPVLGQSRRGLSGPVDAAATSSRRREYAVQHGSITVLQRSTMER